LENNHCKHCQHSALLLLLSVDYGDGYDVVPRSDTVPAVFCTELSVHVIRADRTFKSVQAHLRDILFEKSSN